LTRVVPRALPCNPQSLPPSSLPFDLRCKLKAITYDIMQVVAAKTSLGLLRVLGINSVSFAVSSVSPIAAKAKARSVNPGGCRNDPLQTRQPPLTEEILPKIPPICSEIVSGQQELKAKILDLWVLGRLLSSRSISPVFPPDGTMGIAASSHNPIISRVARPKIASQSGCGRCRIVNESNQFLRHRPRLPIFLNPLGRAFLCCREM